MVCDGPVCIYSQKMNQVAVLDHSGLWTMFRTRVLMTNISALIITLRELDFKCMVVLYPWWILHRYSLIPGHFINVGANVGQYRLTWSQASYIKLYWLHSGIYNGCIYSATVGIFQQWLSSDHLRVLSHRVAQIFLSVEAACTRDQKLCEAHVVALSCCL